MVQKGAVADRPIAQWVIAWWNWYYSIEEKNHPAYASPESYGIRSNDYNQGRVPLYATPANWPADTQEKVWFYSGAYGKASEARSIIPVGDWHILAPVYNMGASTQEFPSLTKADIQQLVEHDVDGAVDNYSVILDGDDISEDVQRVKWAETGWFFVKGIPQENILALDIDSIEMVSDGFWLFLKPLEPGDHKLHLKGESKNYLSDKLLNITVRGPLGKNS